MIYDSLERKCPVCGKNFIMSAYHIYKKHHKNKIITFCGWNCMRFFEKDNSCLIKEGK